MKAVGKDQKGFSHLEIILVGLVVMLIGFAGWMVYNKNKEDKLEGTSNQTSINSFEECVAAGNPVMESYPEQCAANGKTFTNPNTKDSLTYLNERIESGNKTFSITFPDGWGPITRNTTDDFLIITGEKQPVVSQGTKPVVNNVEAHGGDGPTVFAVFVEDRNDYKPQGDSSPFSIGKGNTLLSGTKYSYTYEKDEEPGFIGGRLKNDRAYEYVFDIPNNKRIRAWYNVYGTDPVNNVVIVEQILQTITLN